MAIEPLNVWLCQECDTIINKKLLVPYEKIHCPNCNYTIVENSCYSLKIPLAIAITGLLLLITTCFLPMIHMKMYVNITEYNVISGLYSFIKQSQWIPASLIFFGVILSPFIYFLFCTIILIFLIKGIEKKLLINMIHIFSHIRVLCMLDVYLLSIFISIIKLKDIATVLPDYGLIVLIILIICQLIILFTVKPYILWNALENVQRLKKCTQYEKH